MRRPGKTKSPGTSASASGKTKTSAPTKVLLLLALHAALLHSAEAFRCPTGMYDNLSHKMCDAQTDKCCMYTGKENSWACGDAVECTTAMMQDGHKNVKCLPTNEKPCCAKKDTGFHTDTYVDNCDNLERVIKCPQRGTDGKWNAEKKCPEKENPCCEYSADGDLDYTCGRDCKPNGGGPNECQPTLNGEKCCAKADGSGNFVKSLTTCPARAHPSCPRGPAGSSPFETCESGCCVYDPTTKIFECEARKNGKCPEDSKKKKTCKARTDSAELQKCCVNQYEDGFTKLPMESECPKKVTQISCPREVAERPETLFCLGECCAVDGVSKSKCANGDPCKKPDVCRPDGDHKCCLNSRGAAVVQVEKGAQCPEPLPLCPAGKGETLEYCEYGCCVFDYASKSFFCGEATDGKCPLAKQNEQTCRAVPGLPCCAHPDGGFEPEEAGNCSSPIIKCGKAVGKEPEPCADGTFKCCVHHACSTDCAALKEGPFIEDKCTPVNTALDKGFKKCCVNKHDYGYVQLTSGAECSKSETRLILCPLEVAEWPARVKCVYGHTEPTKCCGLDGVGRGKCSEDCQAPGVCHPGLGRKCCLNAEGTALRAGNATTCPEAQCSDLKAAKKAECKGKGPGAEACSAMMERCAVDATGPAEGSDCAAAWLKCEVLARLGGEENAAAETHGRSLLLHLLATTLLLLFPH